LALIGTAGSRALPKTRSNWSFSAACEGVPLPKPIRPWLACCEAAPFHEPQCTGRIPRRVLAEREGVGVPSAPLRMTTWIGGLVYAGNPGKMQSRSPKQVLRFAQDDKRAFGECRRGWNAKDVMALTPPLAIEPQGAGHPQSLAHRTRKDGEPAASGAGDLQSLYVRSKLKCPVYGAHGIAGV